MKKRSFMIHYEITPSCMQAGLHDTDNVPGYRDVIDNLAAKLRKDIHVRQMLEQVRDGKLDKVIIGIGKEIEMPTERMK